MSLRLKSKYFARLTFLFPSLFFFVAVWSINHLLCSLWILVIFEKKAKLRNKTLQFMALQYVIAVKRLCEFHDFFFYAFEATVTTNHHIPAAMHQNDSSLLWSYNLKLFHFIWFSSAVHWNVYEWIVKCRAIYLILLMGNRLFGSTESTLPGSTSLNGIISIYMFPFGTYIHIRHSAAF